MVVKTMSTSRKKTKHVLKSIKDSWQWYLLLLPGLLYLIVFAYGPMYGVQIAFKDYKANLGIWGSKFVGLKHFLRFFSYPYFWKMIRNTFSFTLYSLATFPMPIIFALLLNELQSMKFKKAIQMITYMPHFLSEVVVCSLILLFLDRTRGPINNLIAFLGGERQSFIGKPEYFTSIYALSGLWQNLGWSSILYISALSSIPPEEIEAARIDGASKLQIIWHINLPGIMPTVIITLILSMGSLLNVGYSKIMLLQNDMVLDRSRVISTYVYEMGVVGGQYSYSSAIGLFNNIVNIIILLTANAAARLVSETSLF